MRKKVLSISLTVIILLISACKAPMSDFTWSPKEPVAGEEVKFTNMSQNARSYSWNFGDMSIGSDANPTHVYKRSGNFIVDLRAHNGLRSDEKTVTIVVK